MSYLPKLAPVVGNGLGGMPKRSAGSSGAQSALGVVKQAVTVTNATSAGQLIYQEVATGAHYSVNPSVAPSGPALSALTGPVVKAAQQSVATGVTAAFTDVSISPANGDIVVIYRNANPLYAKRYNSDMVQQGADIAVSAGNTRASRVCHAPNGQFAVSFELGATPKATASIYNADGTFVASVGPATGATAGCCATFLPNGNLVLAWYVTTTGAVTFGIYTPAGATVGTFVAYTTTTGIQLTLRLAATASGDFVLSAMNPTGNTASFSMFSSAGASLGAAVSMPSGGTLYHDSHSVVSLPSGGFVVCYNNTGTPAMRWYTSAGVFEIQTVGSTADIGSGFIAGGAFSNGDAGIFNAGKFDLFSSAKVLRGTTTIAAPLASATYGSIASSPTSNDFAICGVNASLPYFGTFQQYATGSYRLAGIAMSAASAGASIDMQTSGLYAGALAVTQFAANYSGVGGKVISIANNQALIG